MAPFPHPMREQIYRHYLAAIRRRDARIPVTLCTESLSMWQALGDQFGRTPADYVCGCGAGATPGLQRLTTNPWSDARAAVHEDGTKVFADREEGSAGS